MRAYQINGKPLQYFLPFIWYGLLETFSKDCERVEEKRRARCFASRCDIFSEDEPQESVSRATFSSMVQPYLVVDMAIFVN